MSGAVVQSGSVGSAGDSPDSNSGAVLSGHCASANLVDARSSRAEVRNPIVALPAFKLLQGLSPESRAVLRQLLLEIRDHARTNAEKCWRKHKAPMAVYWKVVAVYTGHIARTLRPLQASEGAST